MIDQNKCGHHNRIVYSPHKSVSYKGIIHKIMPGRLLYKEEAFDITLNEANLVGSIIMPRTVRYFAIKKVLRFITLGLIDMCCCVKIIETIE